MGQHESDNAIPECKLVIFDEISEFYGEDAERIIRAGGRLGKTCPPRNVVLQTEKVPAESSWMAPWLKGA